MNKVIFGICLAALAAGCVPQRQRTQEDARRSMEERLEWSRTEMRDYSGACLAKQPVGVKREEAETFCACKTLGLAMKFASPTAAEATLPTDTDLEIYERTGESRRMMSAGFAEYARVVEVCKTSVRKKYGIPQVALEVF